MAACTGIQHTRIYTGTQRPTAGTCDPASSATLTQRGTAIVLASADGTLTLPGKVENNTLAARVTLPGTDHVPYPISFTGLLAGQGISGTLTTPRCRYALDLKLTSD